jgi:uncharacterized MAPEG superfamily protein
MNPSAFALVGYAAWTLVLLGGIAVLRSSLTLSGRREANSFGVDGSDVSEFSNRLCRAHANCYESLPIFGALVLAALVTGHGGITDALAPWVLAARVGQSVTHLISTSSQAVLVRFGFFSVQFAIEVYFAVALLHVALAGSQS